MTVWSDSDSFSPNEKPRIGKYTVTFFSGPTRFPQVMHMLEILPGNKYRVLTGIGDKFLSEGTYELDAKNNVRWLTGLYKDEKYDGTFTVDGNRDQIHMKDRVYARNEKKD
jgi:hypothetical protein